MQSLHLAEVGRAWHLDPQSQLAGKLSFWRYPPTPVNSEDGKGPDGKGPDRSGKFNFHEQCPDNGDGKEDFGTELLWTLLLEQALNR